MRLRTIPAAKYLGDLSPRTLEKWRTTGGGPVYRKIGGVVVYDTEDLDRFLAAATRTSTSDNGTDRPAA